MKQYTNERLMRRIYSSVLETNVIIITRRSYNKSRIKKWHQIYSLKPQYDCNLFPCSRRTKDCFSSLSQPEVSMKDEEEEDSLIQASSHQVTNTERHNPVRSQKEDKVDIQNHFRQSSEQNSRLEQLRKRLNDEDLTQFPTFSTHDSPKAISETLTQEELDELIRNLRIQDSSFKTKSNENILTDSFNRFHNYLRISLVEKCNLRCQYCMPSEGISNLTPQHNLLNTKEIQDLINVFCDAGVDKIRLTGGEPLLRKDLVELVKYISCEKKNVRSIGITTNGITLARHWENLVNAGLTHVNISLDTLDETKFTQITRRKGLSQVLQAIKLAASTFEHHGRGRVKVNCVIMKDFNQDEMIHFCKLLEEYPNIDIRFIEWMPFFNNGWNTNRFVSFKEMQYTLESYHGTLHLLDSSPNDTTKWFHFKDSQRRIGFITSMSEHFCSTCNRLRITADGKLKVCLFGSKEVDLKQILRSGDADDLRLIIDAAVKQKTFALGGYGTPENIAKANENRAMTLIGG